MHEGPPEYAAALDTPESVAKYYNACIRPDPEVSTEVESLFTLCLNARLRPIGHFRVAEGTLSEILCHPREVFRGAIVAAASSLVLIHNHPSGDPTPSEGDIRATRELIRAGLILKITVNDHVIIGRATQDRPRGWCSLRELGYFYST
jgi:DNA repair protein RadC